MEGQPSGLVDVHCHILPALDDGALDLVESLAMARQAAEDGIAVVCATPHIREDHDIGVGELAVRLGVLNDAISKREIPVTVARGGEVAERAALWLDAPMLRAVTLAGKDGLLLEPAPGPLSDDLQELAERLRDEGLQVLIAHPERHAGEDFEDRLRKLAEAGSLIQWTAAFLTGVHGDLALQFAGKGLLHLLGSDSHSAYEGRPVAISAAVERLRDVRTPEQVAWIAHEAPWALLRGEPVVSPF